MALQLSKIFLDLMNLSKVLTLRPLYRAMLERVLDILAAESWRPSPAVPWLRAWAGC